MKICFEKICLLCVTTFLVLILTAQNETPSLLQSLSVDLSTNHGFFMAEKSKTQYLKDGNTNFFELAFSVQTAGQKDWHVANSFPKIGVALMVGNSGSNEYLGRMAAIYPFVNFPIYRAKRFYTGFRLGLGVGWIQKIFDKNDNYKNMVIGTHLNACISTLFQAEWYPLSQVAVTGGLGFTHLSNGSIIIPNLGLNIPSASVGVKYLFKQAPELKDHEIKSQSKKWRSSVFLFAAGKQAYPIESAVYLVPSLIYELMKPIRGSSRIGAGLNLTFDKSLKKEIYNATEYEFDRTKSQAQISVYGSYEHVLGRLSIPLQIGFYVYNNYVVNSSYQNLGVRYQFSSKMTAALQLKTHLGKADYIQWGLGYKF